MCALVRQVCMSAMAMATVEIYKFPNGLPGRRINLSTIKISAKFILDEVFVCTEPSPENYIQRNELFRCRTLTRPRPLWTL